VERKKWLEEWKKSVIIPIMKRRREERIRDYRGVTLVLTIYKIYTSVLAEKLREEMERKGLIPSNQTSSIGRIVAEDEGGGEVYAGKEVYLDGKGLKLREKIKVVRFKRKGWEK